MFVYDLRILGADLLQNMCKGWGEIPALISLHAGSTKPQQEPCAPALGTLRQVLCALSSSVVRVMFGFGIRLILVQYVYLSTSVFN